MSSDLSHHRARIVVIQKGEPIPVHSYLGNYPTDKSEMEGIMEELWGPRGSYRRTVDPLGPLKVWQRDVNRSHNKQPEIATRPYYAIVVDEWGVENEFGVEIP